MKLVVVGKNDNKMINKIELFGKENNLSLECLDYLKQDNNEDTSISINEVVLNIEKDKISNICYFTGTKDNKLIELKIKNLKDGETSNNQKFIKNVTDYAFNILNAETTTIFSNNENDKNIISVGYESLGAFDGINTYVKDRQIIEEMGNKIR